MQTSAVGASGSSSVGTGKKVTELNTEDFLKLLITQLGNQDPFEPVKNQDLLNQVGSIRNLEMSQKSTKVNEELSYAIKGLTLQTNISSAAGLIGKTVKGVDEKNDITTGVVTGLRVVNGNIMLDLDSGRVMNFDNVMQIGTRVNADPGTDAVA